MCLEVTLPPPSVSLDNLSMTKGLSLYLQRRQAAQIPTTSSGYAVKMISNSGPYFGEALVLMNGGAAVTYSNPGNYYTFPAAEMHGNDLQLIECEVYQVEETTELEKPWRVVAWDSQRRKELMDSVSKYEPLSSAVSQVRVLLVGPVGAGKSSFFNSINSVFRGYVTSQAMAGCSATSLTTQFNSATPLHSESQGYRKSPELKDKIHCVVYVLDSCKISIMPDKLEAKLSAVRRKANLLAGSVTKVDEACPLVKDDLTNVYKSGYIKDLLQEASAHLGLPVSCVLPLKNYSEELSCSCLWTSCCSPLCSRCYALLTTTSTTRSSPKQDPFPASLSLHKF
ncbi:hypothetical protein WMY93_001587 [Mugilogobius chulae]|uniref:Interferon-induced protein 44-like n=1 Tax=Mugilogobius chulae TaxID=88201 RepID=A0AAW0PR63_9GOBI